MNHTSNRRLVIIIGGSLTTSRIAHLRKILEIGVRLFSKIIIVHEGLSPLILKNKGIEAICTGVPNIEAKMPFPWRVIGYVLQEFKKFKKILRYVEEKDIVLFLGIYQPISLLSVKLRKCPSIIFGGGFDITRSVMQNKFFNTIYFFFRCSFQIGMLKLFDRIILESSSVKDFYNLDKFSKKLLYAHLFIPSIFTLTNPFNKRDIDLAFMGVLSKEKGIIEFLKTCNILKNKNVAIRVVIWGDGVLKDQVEQYINKNNLSALVQLKNFVDPYNVPKILNKIKLLVIPSYSEGLPNILLEAMACGTPVLATPVGGIPDLLKEGETGFLLKSNNPEHIAERVIELLNKPDILEKVSVTAYNYVRENFSFEKTLESWQRILQEI
ncbi:MAG: glycosyltransferase family 4 protein [Candidatus Verstraetearchaeota archaeon]|nr:glycosyltransferase family 4 protein [Candidatus Verstraetearchaeota archaeon]